MANRSQALASLALLAAVAGITVLGVQCAHADPLTPRSTLCPSCTLEREAPDTSVPHLEIVSDSEQPLPTFGDGVRRFVLGQAGERYRVKIVNPTPARIEAIVSVDGLDAIDGRPADLSKRGYIVPAYGETIVDGWRTSLATVATFRFSSVSASYAGRKGRDRNVGVIGVAFFREQPPPVVRRRAPAQWHDSADDSELGAARPSAAGAAPRPGLGTQYGETDDSRVVETTFVRATRSPTWMSELRYDDRAGLLARGIAVDPPRDPRAAENELRDEATAFPEPHFAQPPR